MDCFTPRALPAGATPRNDEDATRARPYL